MPYMLSMKKLPKDRLLLKVRAPGPSTRTRLSARGPRLAARGRDRFIAVWGAPRRGQQDRNEGRAWAEIDDRIADANCTIMDRIADLTGL